MSFSQSFQQRDAAAQLTSEAVERPEWLVNTKPSPNFDVLCRLFESLRDKPQKRRDQIVNMIQQWRANVGPDLYPFFRLLLPERDRERATYGIKETALAKCYVEVLGLDPKSDAGHRLIHWKQPRPGDEATGDFPSVCYEAIKLRKSATRTGGLTVDGVNNLLDKLHTCRDRKDHIKIIDYAMQNLSAEAQRWVIRIILKDLKAGVREKTVLAAFHPQAIELFNVSSDLKRVCYFLADPHLRLDQKDSQVKVFHPFLPQLCKRLGSTDLNVVVKMMQHKPFLMEEKMDGERIQLHKKGNEYVYASRKGHFYSYLYGEHVGAGTLTPYIHSAFNANVSECILDGEMLVWDPLLEKYLAFGTLKSAALDTSKSEDSPRPCFKVFDILMLNGTCLTNYTLRKRREVLCSKSGEPRVFRPVLGRLELADVWEGKDASDIKDRLEWVMENRGEGLVIKNPVAAYELNGRSEQWIKVKPEYADELGENMDVSVLGGWWGKGARGGKIASLLFGLRIENEKKNEDDQPTFATFGRAGGGLSYADHKWLQDKHSHHFIPFDRSNPPGWIRFGPTGLDDKPDVYIRPEHSFVIEVKASEIIPADGNFAAGLTLRFPRVKYIRHDRASKSHHTNHDENDGNDEDEKSWDAWDSLSLQELIEFNNQRLERRYEPSQQTAKKKRKITNRRVTTISSSFAGQQVTGPVEKDIFHGRVFHIVRGNKEFDKKHLEQLVVKYGGDFCQKRTDNNEATVVSSVDTMPVVRGHIRKGLTIVRPEWIIASIQKERMLPLISELVLAPNAETRAGRHFFKSLEDMDNLPGLSEDGEMESDEELRQIGSALESEDESVERKHKPVFNPPEDIVLGDRWVLRDVKVDPELHHDTESEARSEGDSHSEAADHDEEEEEIQEESVRPTLQDASESEEAEPRFVPDNPALKVIPNSPPSDLPERSPVDHRKAESLSAVQEPSSPLAPVSKAEATPAKMGETNGDIDYNESKYFRHLVFYLDTNENASRNGLNPPDGVDDDPLEEIAGSLKGNGGRVTDDLHDPKLTHIVCAGAERYESLVKATSEPHRKQIVMIDWVFECQDEGTLVAEDGFRP
ncbi:hypothetical protein NliqN6_3970 [Naganishia liquefaciens]|uniref:DNA ligase n=1 Tax=Naganishia liquefaciens TaxID=104408 RepID=A0A8H3TUY6_9TREE|nr:hypothetical protein NliqN6_3970 [Naganishia liquefaciens]